MDAENDLEEQLTSYHICKLPSDGQENENIGTIESENPPPCKKTKPGGYTAKASATPKSRDNYTLEVFTVETQATNSSKEAETPIEPAKKTPSYKVPGEQPATSQAQSGNKRRVYSNSKRLHTNVDESEKSRTWYQLPKQQSVQQGNNSAQAPSQMQIVLNYDQNLMNSQNVSLSSPASVKQSENRVQRMVQQNETSSPVAYIKIEDDDDDVCVINNSVSSTPQAANPPIQIISLPPPLAQQPQSEVRHVIKLVTSVPVSRYPCEFCGAVFELWNHRENHIETKHKVNGMLTCYVCVKAAATFYIKEESIYRNPHYHYLQAHLAESHKVTGQPRGFQCPYCSISPASYTALVQHLTFDHDTAALMNSYVLVNVLEDRLET
ncbi:hypothetical protein DMENIID0001_083390 [Sergentomyia squamirostris]